jgi:hypothetical protein
MQNKDSLLNEQLDAFTQVVIGIIENLWKAGQIRRELEPVQQTVIDDFTYTANGPNYTGSSHLVTYVENWMRAAFTIGKSVFKMSEYLSIINFITKEYPDPNSASRFHQYAFRLFPLLLKNRLKPSQYDYDALKNKLICEIGLKAHRCLATVKLFGIVLESSEVVICEGIIIRQVIKTDLEAPSQLGSDHTFAALPSAVLEITMQLKANDHGVLQQKVAQYVKLIRLFDLGSVTYNSYKMEFDTISAPGAEMGMAHQLFHPWKKYFLQAVREKDFLNFLNQLPLSIGFCLFDKNANHITTAFDRFSEAVLENVAVERKVANAVMGIEALLSDGTNELAFKMQTRTAKVLSSFGFEPIVARNHLKEAYAIRSKFAHGDYLTTGKKAELQKMISPNGDFPSTIINYLRILIITELAIDISKPQLIKLIDDAFIDNSVEQQLRLKLELAKPFIFTI